MEASEFKIMTTAMDLIGEYGWRNFSLSMLQKKLPDHLEEITDLYKIPSDVLQHFNRHIDQKMFHDAHQEFGDISGPSPSPLQAKERLFGLIMLRFEALQPYKKALLSIYDEGWVQAGTIGTLAPYLLCTFEDMLFFAGLPTEGIGGVLMVQGVVALYLTGLRVWITDDTDDMAKTMAHVDRFLNWGEVILPYVQGAE